MTMLMKYKRIGINVEKEKRSQYPWGKTYKRRRRAYQSDVKTASKRGGERGTLKSG